MLKQIDSLGVTEESGLYVHNISSARNGIGLLIVDPQNDFHPGMLHSKCKKIILSVRTSF